MGQKVNPRGLRIGTVLKWKNNWYTEPSNYLSKFYKNLNIKNLIKTFLLLKSERSLLVDFFIYDINGYKSYGFVKNSLMNMMVINLYY
jgi:hypothetical protein